jgi:hypothetical protein
MRPRDCGLLERRRPRPPVQSFLSGGFAKVYRIPPCRILPAMPPPPTTGALLRVAATASDAGKGFRVTGSSKRHHTPRA